MSWSPHRLHPAVHQFELIKTLKSEFQWHRMFICTAQACCLSADWSGLCLEETLLPTESSGTQLRMLQYETHFKVPAHQPAGHTRLVHEATFWPTCCCLSPLRAPHLGRELVCKESKKNFKATIAMSQDFPLGIESWVSSSHLQPDCCGRR